MRNKFFQFFAQRNTSPSLSTNPTAGPCQHHFSTQASRNKAIRRTVSRSSESRFFKNDVSRTRAYVGVDYLRKISLNRAMNSTSLVMDAPFLALTPTQKIYRDCLKSEDYDLIIATGPSGTGKTWIACKVATEQLLRNKVSKIVLTRSNARSNEIDKYKHLIDYLKHETTPIQFNTFVKNRKIEICFVDDLQGKTFDNAYVIGDDMQYCSKTQLTMLMTRLGKRSKLVLTGNTEQCMLNKEGSVNGFAQLNRTLRYTYIDPCELFKDRIVSIEFGNSDSKRSSFVSKIIKLQQINTLHMETMKSIQNRGTSGQHTESCDQK